MKDRTGEVWRDGGVVFLVTGPPKHHSAATWRHPVAILESETTFWEPGGTDTWPEEGLKWEVWEKHLERLS